MNHGGKWDFDFGTVKYVVAIHTSSFPDGTYGGQPGGFVIEGEHKNIYIAGDTALTMDMKLIPRYTKRSEEHTSELQSRGHLVCRRLLENKKGPRGCPYERAQSRWIPIRSASSTRPGAISDAAARGAG